MAGGGGGAWKVAYADFVTAMMALFMVLWISAQDQEILIATSRYFQSPFNSPLDASAGVMPSDASGETASDSTSGSIAEMSLLNELAREFYKLLNIEDTDRNSPVEIRVTNDGLRITVFDRTDRPLFLADRAEFTDWGRFVVQNLAWVLERYHFRVRIDGHTAAGYQGVANDYTAWELSADRANATRRALQFYAVSGDRIERVTGFADTVPLPAKAPDDPANQRIELSMVIAEPLRPLR